MASLDQPNSGLRYLKGVGPKVAEVLAEKEIFTVEDLLSFFPNRYLDRRSLSKIVDLQPGANQVTAGKILSCGMVFAGRGRKIFEILLGDDSGTIMLKWFRFQPARMLGAFRKGMGLIVSGDVTRFRTENQFLHPTLQIMDADVVEEIAAPGYVPVYPQIPGLGQKFFRKILQNALDHPQSAEKIFDPIPTEIREKFRLPDKEIALRDIHFPSLNASAADLENLKTPAYKREIFEEFFMMELGLALKRRTITRESGTSLSVADSDFEAWQSALPFSLTGAQKRVLREIFSDVGEPHPMNRLLQGDVGSGKTIVAFLAALAAIRQGHQAALMAPTEILAEQHVGAARKFFAAFDVPVALLTGKLEAGSKRRAQSRVGKGIFPFVVGTHALISDAVTFSSLKFVIIDEQHRFGVLQRAALKAKGENPHVLVMTATPIPRTLAMTIYGDLEVSVIDEMPPGRQKIHTEIVEEKSRVRLYRFLREVLGRGEQGYVVYPLIEESEKLALRDATRMHAELQEAFPDIKIALMHGKTPSEEKETIMKSFKAGDIQLLVSTTVIEVGIDVPNATVMVIEHAERFGLSQLHQLRGRVGRGSKASYCLLVTPISKTHEGYKRLQVMCETQDGFKIAEEDLKIRGPGDFLGTRQSGLPELRLANLIRDHKILEVARKEAFAWLAKDPHLETYPGLKETLMRRWGQRLSLAGIG